MNPSDRRTELRREEDRVLSYRVELLEEQIRTFAPTAAAVSLHEYQLDEGRERMKTLEDGLGEVQIAVADLLKCINAVKIDLKGMSVRLSLITGIAGLVAGTVASAVVAFVT